jgi:PAS domain S-box-containing protein
MRQALCTPVCGLVFFAALAPLCGHPPPPTGPRGKIRKAFDCPHVVSTCSGVMLTDVLQDRAALYAAGAMTAPERENFELVLEFHTELRALVAGLQDTTAVALRATVPAIAPPAALRERIFAALAPQAAPADEPMVVTNPAGLVEWINPAFTGLCGYTLPELSGRKPGALLQGPRTDRTAVDRIRRAMQELRPCHETLLNYHKDGSPYRVDVRITPILDDDRQPLWFVAQERKLADVAA